ncbi:MAG: hypothetical protein R2912_01120 [Eubacteriales bacterium]
MVGKGQFAHRQRRPVRRDGRRAVSGGRAGERFCVRNSGVSPSAKALATTAANTMTGGTAVILGSVEEQFCQRHVRRHRVCARRRNFKRMVNMKMVALYDLDALDLVMLHKHPDKPCQTHRLADCRKILDKGRWLSHAKFVKVLPHDYKEMLGAMDVAEREGLEGDEMLERAFQLKAGKTELAGSK